MFILLALLAGALVIICISINGQLSSKVGLIQAGMTNFFVGLICSFVYFYLINGFQLNQIFIFKREIPFYFFFGGVIGSLIMVLNNLVINRLSAVYVTILTFLGQLTTGIVIDYLKLEILSAGKFIGVILIIIGLYYYIKCDKEVANSQDASIKE